MSLVTHDWRFRSRFITHDEYFQIRLGDKTIRTSTKENSSDPQWDETFDFLCYDYDQVISFYAWDHDTLGGDDDLEKSQISVRQVLLRGQTAKLELHGGTHTGGRIVLCCQLCPFSLSDLASLESSTYSVENESRITGRLTVVIVGSKDIPLPKEDAKPWVKVVYGAIEFKTGTVENAPAVDCLNPFFDYAFCVRMRPDTDLKAPVELILMSGEDTALGSTIITYKELVEKRTITESRAFGGQGAMMEFRVALAGVIQPASTPTSALLSDLPAQATTSSVTAESALGKVQITILRGWGFEVETSGRLIKRKDVPNVYCDLTFGSNPNVWRTRTVRDSIMPEWNERNNYLLSDHGQIIDLQVFDEDKGRDEDDELGAARVPIRRLLLTGGTLDVELRRDGRPTGQYLSVSCIVLDHERDSTKK